MYDTKIGIILRDDLPSWQQLNVTAFLMSGIAKTAPESVGENYKDGSGNEYLPMFVQPVMAYAASAEQLQRTRSRAAERGVTVSIFTQEIFQTFNDVDNRAAVAEHEAQNLNIVGIGLRCDKKTFDKIVKGLKLHP